jgi:hypothetical protein
MAETTRFKPGQTVNPNGRPKGSRHKLSEAFIADIYNDWQKHGAEVIEGVRRDKPAVYVKIVASLIRRSLHDPREQDDRNAGVHPRPDHIPLILRECELKLRASTVAVSH